MRRDCKADVSRPGVEATMRFARTDRRYATAGVALGLCIWQCLLPEAAVAHITQEAQGGFGSGFEHPLTGPDHFLAMFAVGLWGAQMGGRSVWTLPVTFPLVMVAGGILGILGIPLPGIE